MSTTTTLAEPARVIPRAGLLWLAALGVSLLWPHLPRGAVPSWAMDLPRAWQWPLARQLGGWMRWLIDDASLGFVTVKELTRGMAWLLEWPLWLATGLFATGLMHGQGSTATQILPPLPWLSVTALAALLGWTARDWRLGALAGGCFLYL
ncbi:MAG: hypothetical protein AB7O95_19500, partial [Geminicoccaceae bacterium]